MTPPTSGMTDDEIKALIALADKATAGPWKQNDHVHDGEAKMSELRKIDNHKRRFYL